MELKHMWQKRCIVVGNPVGEGGEGPWGFGQIFLTEVASKSVETPYFHVLLHFYDQGFQNVTPPSLCASMCERVT
jgi:hypothetical protein